MKALIIVGLALIAFVGITGAIMALAPYIAAAIVAVIILVFIWLGDKDDGAN